MGSSAVTRHGLIETADAMPSLKLGSCLLLFPQRIGDAVLLQLAVERGLADAQQLGGLQLVAVQGADRAQNGLALQIGQRLQRGRGCPRFVPLLAGGRAVRRASSPCC